MIELISEKCTKFWSIFFLVQSCNKYKFSGIYCVAEISCYNWPHYLTELVSSANES